MTAAALALASTYAAEHPGEVARLVETASAERMAEFLAGLPLPAAAAVLGAATPLAAAGALSAAEPVVGASLLEAIEPGAAAALLRRVDEGTSARLASALSPERASQVAALVRHGPERAGGRLDPRAIAVPETLTVDGALARVRAEPAGALYYVYVVDDAQRLVGVVNLRELMLAPPEARVADVMIGSPERVGADEPLAAVVRHPAWRRVHALPVVDADGRFLGALRYSAFRAIETELGRAASGPDAARAAGALAELYSLGAAAFVTWAGAAFSSEGSREGGVS